MTTSTSRGKYTPINPVVLGCAVSAPNRNQSHPVVSAIVGNNSDLMLAVAKLWISSIDVVVDATFGRGVFWRQLPGLPTYAYDLQTGQDFRHLPLPSCSVDVLVLDPPYRPTHGQFNNNNSQESKSMLKRYGLGLPQLDSINDVINLYSDGIKEAYRVLKHGGRIMVKCQDMSYSNKLHLVSYDILREIIQAGFEFADQFILIGGSGLKSSAWTNQDRARRNHSVLWVGIKLDDKKKGA